MKNLKAIILAGGLGTRLRPITYEIPKPLLTVKKKPIINYLIELFLRYDISEIGVLTNNENKDDFVFWQKNLSDNLASKIQLFFSEKRRGTFGELEYVKDWLGDNTRFILSNGDELKDFDLKNLFDFHNEHRPIGTIALVHVPNPHEYGVPILENHIIKEFLEKPQNPPSNFISSGLYILESEIFNYADFSKEILMIEKDIFPKLANEGKLIGLKMEGGKWCDCGTLERWERAIKDW